MVAKASTHYNPGRRPSCEFVLVSTFYKYKYNYLSMKLSPGSKRKADSITEEVEEEQESNLVGGDTSSSDDTPPPLYSQGDKVLARDNDGLMYIAFVRRAHYGIPQQHKVDLMDTIEGAAYSDDDENMSPRWFYFVHYLAWKVNWDRWVAEQDLCPFTEKYLGWQQTIQSEHKQLLRQFKQGKRVDGGAFLKAWKPKLESLMRGFQGEKPKVVKKESKPQFQPRKNHLLTRTPGEMSLLHLPSGLKRVLVEEWEILNGPFGMVHQLQPDASLRRLLDLYLESKGVKQGDEKAIIEKQTNAGPQDDLSNGSQGEAKQSNSDDSTLDDTQRRHKEWTDMADGICQLMDQSLPFRLLYPTEQSQLATLLDDDTVTSLSAHYGSVHFLRLCCQLPLLLQEQYDEELQQHLVKPLLAKVNDFLRFLQEHHHQAFPQHFRKKTMEEEKLEQKWIKKHEKQRAVGGAEELPVVD